ncbi:hypothetical protein [Deinococcus peraridilitoris]|nr:hypothetical protein [Deinococcus peraridilitoris]
MSRARLCLCLWLLALPLGLGACAPGEGASANAELEQRVQQLEGEVQQLRKELGELRGSDQSAAQVTDLAGARTCALDLARVMEAFRTDNDRYPRASEVTFPGSCAELRVDWRVLQGQRYAFDVRDRSGTLLTREENE